MNNGLKLGDARVHPFFDLEGRYDSAAGLFPNGSGVITLSPELITHFRPGLRLELLSPNLELNLTGGIDYVLYTGALTSSSTKSSHLEAFADLNTAINKQGAVELDISDHFARSDRTTNVAAALGFISLFNEARLGVPIHPGGRALEVTPKGAFATEDFSPLTGGTVNPICPVGAASCDFSSLNYQNVQGGLEARWRFLPKTAIIFDGTFDYRKYNSNAPPPTKLIKASAGLAGLISTKISVIAKAGYANDSSGSGGRSLIAQAELGYLLSDLSSIHIGYFRTVNPVSYYGAFGTDRGYASGTFLFNGRLSLRLYGAYDYLNYFTGNVGGGSRNDRIGTIDVGPEYELMNWFRVAAGYNLQARSSTANVTTPNFTRHEVYLRFTFTY